ncbi:hypothetical protein [Streptomyces sp. NPDC058678]|uniref:hypothetical protein n=1 Tax=Streptomyces sp. NPDC058678 TaxID=3346595 RepID=UPI00365459E2
MQDVAGVVAERGQGGCRGMVSLSRAPAGMRPTAGVVVAVRAGVTARTAVAAAARHRHPVALDAHRWEAQRTCALRTGHSRDPTCTPECEPVLVYERTPSGRLAWTVPGDGITRPEPTVHDRRQPARLLAREADTPRPSQVHHSANTLVCVPAVLAAAGQP